MMLKASGQDAILENQAKWCRDVAEIRLGRDVTASVADASQPSGSVPGGQGGNVKF
jgi:hypothetical protein